MNPTDDYKRLASEWKWVAVALTHRYVCQKDAKTCQVCVEAMQAFTSLMELITDEYDEAFHAAIDRLTPAELEMAKNGFFDVFNTVHRDELAKRNLVVPIQVGRMRRKK